MNAIRFAISAACAALLAGCAPGTGPAGGNTVSTRSCVSLFQQLDVVEDFENPLLGDDEVSVPRAVQPVAGWLRNNGCITYSRDLTGMAAALQDPATPRGDGSRQRSGALIHAGAVTSIRDDARALDYFSALGFHSYSLGTPGIGRRVYVGPMATEAGVAAVLDAAQRGGFAYPYVTRTGSSFFGGIVQSR
jgi:hypothetical protein